MVRGYFSGLVVMDVVFNALMRTYIKADQSFTKVMDVMRFTNVIRACCYPIYEATKCVVVPTRIFFNLSTHFVIGYNLTLWLL